MQFLQYINQNSAADTKMLAVLVDPDETEAKTAEVVESALVYGIEIFFVGGSIITEGNTQRTVKQIQALGAKYVVLFPGNEMQIAEEADAILFLSLISGRNPDYLIGKQVAAAPRLALSNLEIISTGYMLIDGGKITSANYISNTIPIPSNKPEIAVATGFAGKFLGMKLLYMDAGSGAVNPINPEMVQKVSEKVQLPLIVGGGIKSAQTAMEIWNAGANIIVVGNGVFENSKLIAEICLVWKTQQNQKVNI